MNLHWESHLQCKMGFQLLLCVVTADFSGELFFSLNPIYIFLNTSFDEY